MSRCRLVKSVGSYGHTVSVFKRGVRYYLRWWDGGRRDWRWRSLRHGDRERADMQARALAGELLAAGNAARTGKVSLSTLFVRYYSEVSTHKKGDQAAEDRRRMALWEAFLGSDREVHTLDHADRFVRERRAGRLSVPGRALRPRVSETTIGADIVFLQAVLNWATRVVLSDGSPLLDRNSVRGYVRPRNGSPQRPVASYDRFLAVRAVADQVDPQGRFGVFMDLVEALGWRVSAVCQLRAENVDRKARPGAPYGRILKRAETDKEGVEQWVPLSEPARAAIDRLPVLGGWLFPSPRDADRPWTRWHARDLLERAEEASGLQPLAGGDFHAYRRKWARERKHLAPQDVAAAGGWRDLRSLQNAYQQVDPMTMLAVVTERRKLREAT